MDHFRECFDRQVAATDELLRNFLTGPAPKEKEMTHRRSVGNMPSQESIDTDHLDAIWDRAYFAALTGTARDSKSCEVDVGLAANIANATISAWPAMTAERDALIRKAVEP